MDIKQYAILLLIGRIASAVFIGMVLWRQWQLFAQPVHPKVRAFRKTLFALAAVVAGSLLIPIVIDILTIFADLEGRSQSVSLVGMLYSASNNLSGLLQSVLIWMLYRMAKQITDEELTQS